MFPCQGGTTNVTNLFRHLLHPEQVLPTPQPEAALRVRTASAPGAQVNERTDADAWRARGLAASPTLVVLDLANSDHAAHQIESFGGDRRIGEG